VTCPVCGWPMTLTATKKMLNRILASFRCTNPQCKHEQTQIG
jgi:hypothetical protein